MLRTPRWALLWTMLRLAVAVLGLSAVIGQAIVSITSAIDNDRDVATTAANFFSFFTILSNIGAIVVLSWAAVWFLLGGANRKAEPRGLALSLASVTAYMLVTGVVYNALLRGLALPQGSTLPWSNEVLHVVVPLFLLADLFLAPRRRALPWRSVVAVLVFPLAWTAYTLVRANLIANPATDDPYWYPYPFLDPNLDGGYLRVSGYVVVIAIAIAAFAFLVIWVGRRRGASDPVEERAHPDR